MQHEEGEDKYPRGRTTPQVCRFQKKQIKAAPEHSEEHHRYSAGEKGSVVRPAGPEKLFVGIANSGKLANDVRFLDIHAHTRSIRRLRPLARDMFIPVEWACAKLDHGRV